MRLPISIVGLAISFSSFAQNVENMQAQPVSRQMPKGIYTSEKEFFARCPNIESPFGLVPNYQIVSLKNNETDTIELGMNFSFLDTSAIRPIDLFGFSDGNDMYMLYEDAFFKLDFVGRFSFVTVRYNTAAHHPIILFNPLSPAAFVSSVVASVAANVAEVSKLREVVLFYNKKGNLVEATQTTLRWFLDDDKDFAKASFKTKHHTNQVYKTFLLKMNERYPEQ